MCAESRCLAGARGDELLQSDAPVDRPRDDPCGPVGGIRPEPGRQKELEPIAADTLGARIAGLDDAANRHTVEREVPALTIVLRAQHPAAPPDWIVSALPSEPDPQCVESGDGRTMRFRGTGEAAEGHGDAVSPHGGLVATGEPTPAMLGRVDAG